MRIIAAHDVDVDKAMQMLNNLHQQHQQQHRASSFPSNYYMYTLQYVGWSSEDACCVCRGGLGPYDAFPSECLSYLPLCRVWY